MSTLQKYWDKFTLALILLLAGFLSIFDIWNVGYGNTFYAASVKSMLTSWSNFFFVSLDPGGWITVDKPPVAFWVQAAFAKVLGFHGWSIILPQALAVVATVAVLYHIVKRHFGTVAGLLSALVLALSPIFIVIGRTNNTDSILILIMVLSAWAMMVAADKGQLRYLLLSTALLGVAYNVKTLEAFMILPALYAVYFFATNIKWRTRGWQLAVATIVLIVVSLSWSAIVDLTPADKRPYVDNSTNNSELELAFNYNGIQRLLGHNKSAPTETGSNEASNQKTGESDENAKSDKQEQAVNLQVPVKAANASGANNGNKNGSASIVRMFNAELGSQGSWLLPFGFLAIFALILRLRKTNNADSETRRKLLQNVLLWGISVLTMFGYFSVAGFFHSYYISVMAPFLAALIGIGLVEMWRMYKAKGAAGFLLPFALAATLAVQIAMFMDYPPYTKVMIPLTVALTGIPAIVLLTLKLMHKNFIGKIGIACVAISIAGTLIAPVYWISSSISASNFNAQTPSVGPNAKTGKSTEDVTRLIRYLERNNTGEKFLVAVSGASEAEPIILATGKPVMAIGGFSGTARTLTVEKLKQMVKAGEIKYYIAGGMEEGKGGISNDLTEWVRVHGKAVDQSEWSNTSASTGNSPAEDVDKRGMPKILYDLSAYKNSN